MGITASSNSFIIVFCVFALLFADLIGTSMNISNLKESGESKDSTEFNKLEKAYNSKLKYTLIIITLVLIYYIVNAITFIFAQNIK